MCVQSLPTIPQRPALLHPFHASPVSNLAALAHKNGWAGMVVHGCIRDAAELAATQVGVKALAAVPRRSAKDGAGARDVEVRFAVVTFVPGHWLYADRDGVVVAERRLH